VSYLAREQDNNKLHLGGYNFMSSQNNLNEILSRGEDAFANVQDIGATTPLSQGNALNYIERYPSNLSNPVLLEDIAQFYTSKHDTYDTPIVPNDLDNSTDEAFYDALTAWWLKLTGDDPPINSSNLGTIIDALVAKGFVVLSGGDPSAAFPNDLNQFLFGFYLVGGGNSLPPTATAEDYANAFLNFQGGVVLPSTQLNYDTIFKSSQTNITFNAPTSYALNLFSFHLPLNANYDVEKITFKNFFAMLEHSSLDPFGVELMNASSLSDSEQLTLFKKSFGTFLMTSKPVWTGPPAPLDWYSDWQKDAMTIALMNYPLGGLIPAETLGSQDSALSIYKTIWQIFYPNATEEDFLLTLLNYINSFQIEGKSFISTGDELEAVNRDSVPVVGLDPGGNYKVGTYEYSSQAITAGFTPAGALTGWMNTLRISAGGSPATDNIGDESGFDQVQLIFDIYLLLLDMLNDLQVMTGVQLQRQLFYGKYQQTYTETAANIPTITGAGSTLPGYNETNNSENVRRRSDVSQMTAQYTESVKSFRSEIGDLSGQQNTAVNQSQESVSQQVNVAQALLQQFSTILQSIWR
jgi:hypothetical protein